MILFSYPIQTASGDEYLVRINAISKKSLPEYLLAALEGIEVFEVTLERGSGNNPTSASILFDITNVIARVLFDNPDSIFYFYCDDLHDIPRRDQNISPQAFRSQLFSRMMDRYVQKHCISNLTNTPVELHVDHDIYIHLIAYAKHLPAVQLLKEAIEEIADK